MTGFTKLWSEILSSSIWNEDDKTRIVWITMLAAMGADGIVRASVGGLAHQARVSVSDCQKSIDKLSSPDPDSRSQDFEGRRIQRVDGGFLILNGGKYREARSIDERKAYMREYMKHWRSNQAQAVNIRVNKRKQMLTSVNSCKPLLAQAEAEAEAEADADADKDSTPEIIDKQMSKGVQGEMSIGSAAVAAPSPPQPKKKNPKPPKQSDQEWLDSLRLDNTYLDLDVELEYGKMLRWCEVNNKTPSRRRFVAWLNRAERPMSCGYNAARAHATRAELEEAEQQYRDAIRS